MIDKNLVFNGVTITADFITAMESYQMGRYNEFGYMFGDAMMTATKEDSAKDMFLY